MDERDFYDFDEFPIFSELWDKLPDSGGDSLYGKSGDVTNIVDKLVTASADEEYEDRHAVREAKKKNICDFMKGFFIALAIMLPLCAGTLYVGYLPKWRLESNGQMVSESAEAVPIAASSYNLLCAVTDDAGAPVAFSLLRADADNRRVAFADLPLVLVALESKTPQTLAEIFAQRGLTGVAAAIGETLGIKIDGRITLTATQLATVVDSLGSFRFSLDEDVVVYSDEGLIEYSKHKGTSDFSGNDVAKVLIFAPHTIDNKTRLHERLFENALARCDDEKLADNLSELYNTLVNSIDTDISAAGIYALSRSVSAVCEEGSAQFVAVRIEGEYADDRFELTENSGKRLWVYIPKNA
ncbi:MAG: hypothetical protein RR998_02360 [Oscillospiraceae bacterium]